MTRRRGNKNSKAVIEQRRVEVADRLKKGERRGALAKELGVSRMTLHRDIKALTVQFQASNREAFTEYRQAHLKVLQQMAQAVLEEKVSTDVAAEFRRYQKDIADLLGLNAESRSVVAHVSTESSPAFLRFKKATAGLTDEQFEAVLDFADVLPRERKTAAKDASWYPPPLALTEGSES
jgi:IS30 family transposase